MPAVTLKLRQRTVEECLVDAGCKCASCRVPSSEDDLSVEGLRRRRKLVKDAFRHVWRGYLKPRSHAAVAAVEVSPRGAVHLHVLYHGCRPDIVSVRELWLSQLPDSPQVNVRYVRQPAKAIREVAKYVTKGASPANPKTLRGMAAEFTDPGLAARVEVAFAGERLVECYGAWRGADDDKDEPEDFEGAACVTCGLVGEWDWVQLPTHELAAALGEGFHPRFVRSGPGPPVRGRAAAQTMLGDPLRVGSTDS
jgi:hypothetical protein